MNEEITRHLEQLAKTLGVTVEYLWKVMVHGQVTDGIVAIIFCVTMITISVIGLRKLFVKFAGDEEGNFFVAIISIIGGTMLLLISVFLFQSISQVLNPEYFALKEILSILKR